MTTHDNRPAILIRLRPGDPRPYEHAAVVHDGEIVGATVGMSGTEVLARLNADPAGLTAARYVQFGALNGHEIVKVDGRLRFLLVRAEPLLSTVKIPWSPRH